MGKEKISGIYCIENKINGKKYIGLSNNIYKRWSYHLEDFEAHRHKNIHLQRAWNKYGEKNFEFSIIERCTLDQLCEREVYWIDYYKSFDFGYNMTRGGLCPDLYAKYTKKEKSEKYNCIRGENNHFAKLKESDVFDIILLLQDDCSLISIANKYHVHIATISMIYLHKTWKHLTDGITFVNISHYNRKSVDMYSLDGQLLKTFKTMTLAAKEINVDVRSVSAVCNGKNKTLKGYIWRFHGHPFDEFYVSQKTKECSRRKSKMSTISVDQYSIDWILISSYSSIVEASQKTKIQDKKILNALYSKKKIANGYRWLEHNQNPDLIRGDLKNHRQKAIDQYDKNGNLIASYVSIKEAADKTGFKISALSAAICGRCKSSNGYYWVEAGHKPIIQKSIKNKIGAIDQYDLSWKLIKTYSSTTEAAKNNNIDSRFIYRVLSKKRKTAGGFYWLRHGEKSLAQQELTA